MAARWLVSFAGAVCCVLIVFETFSLLFVVLCKLLDVGLYVGVRRVLRVVCWCLL